MRSVLGSLLILCGAVTACARDAAPPPERNPAFRAPVQPPSSPPPRRIVDGGVLPPDPPRAAVPWAQAALPELLANEAARRPRVQPRAEAVLAQLQRRGVVSLRGRRQALAAALGAAYCLAAATTSGVGLLVCEHASEVSARQAPETLARLVPGGTVSRRGNTVLLVNPDPGHPKQLATARRLTAIFRRP